MSTKATFPLLHLHLHMLSQLIEIKLHAVQTCTFTLDEAIMRIQLFLKNIVDTDFTFTYILTDSPTVNHIHVLPLIYKTEMDIKKDNGEHNKTSPCLTFFVMKHMI